jgi:hypothetical protein
MLALNRIGRDEATSDESGAKHCGNGQLPVSPKEKPSYSERKLQSKRPTPVDFPAIASGSHSLA